MMRRRRSRRCLRLFVAGVALMCGAAPASSRSQATVSEDQPGPAHRARNRYRAEAFRR